MLPGTKALQIPDRLPPQFFPCPLMQPPHHRTLLVTSSQKAASLWHLPSTSHVTLSLCADFPQRSSQSPLHFLCCCSPFLPNPATQGLDWSSPCRRHPACSTPWALPAPLRCHVAVKTTGMTSLSGSEQPVQRRCPSAVLTNASVTGPWLQPCLSVFPW